MRWRQRTGAQATPPQKGIASCVFQYKESSWYEFVSNDVPGEMDGVCAGKSNAIIWLYLGFVGPSSEFCCGCGTLCLSLAEVQHPLSAMNFY